MANLTEESIITFGAHKGKKLIDVPASYLIWLYENDKCSNELKEYISDNMDALKIEAGI